MPASLTNLRRRASAAVGGALVALGFAVASAATVATLSSVSVAAQGALTPEQKVKRVFAQHSRLGGKVNYDSVAEDGGVLTVKGLKIATSLPIDDPKKPGTKVRKSFLITADEMVIRRYDYKNPELPLFADGEVKGMRFDGELVNNNEMAQFLAAAGLKEIVLDAAFKYTADEKSGTIDVDTYSITLRDVMSFAFALKVDRIDFTKIPKGVIRPGFGVPGNKTGALKIKNPGQVVMQALGKSRLHNLSISLADLGGIEHAMKFFAAEQSKKNPGGPKTTPEMMLAQAKGILAFGKAEIAGAYANSVLDAVGKLLAKPGTLTIAARPNQPVHFVSLMGFAVMMGASAQKQGEKINLDPLQGFLGLQVTYTPAE